MPTLVSPVASMYLPQYRIPSITGYNRIEPAPRSAKLGTSLKAEVRDALWLLTRQWQLGEFQGEDAGTPIGAQMLGEHTAIDRLQFPGEGSVFSYDASTSPLEVDVEGEALTGNLYLAVQIARYYLRLLRQAGVAASSVLAQLQTKYPLAYKVNANDSKGLQLQQAVSGQVFDGFAAYTDMNTASGSGTLFSVWVKGLGLAASLSGSLLTAASALVRWMQRTYRQSPGGSAWSPSQLEYQFNVASPRQTAQPTQKTLVGTQFYGGHADWYSVDLTESASVILTPDPSGAGSVTDNLVSFIPAPISIKGMPQPRFWTMEDSQVDLGNINSSTTGLLHLALAEFGLMYANDWFLLPYPLPMNVLCQVQGIVVTDVFGLQFFIPPANQTAQASWQNWGMFYQTDLDNPGVAGNLFYLAPSTLNVLKSEPLEQVNYLLDDMADLAWGVEDRVPSQAGMGMSGSQMAVKTVTAPVFTPAGDAQIQYVAGTQVPDNWTPFLPVPMQGSVTQVRLQRGAMPDSLGPFGVLLSEVPPPYYINQEEISDSGNLITRVFKRTRWINGKTFLWIGRHRETGTGEGWSNLKFDQIVPIPS